MFSTPETSVHVRDKNREISPLEREEGHGWKDLEKRWVLRREWKTLWDTPTTDLGAQSEPGNGGEHSVVADWQGTRRDGGSLFHRWGAAYRKERLLILRLDWACGYIVNRTNYLINYYWAVGFCLGGLFFKVSPGTWKENLRGIVGARFLQAGCPSVTQTILSTIYRLHDILVHST